MREQLIGKIENILFAAGDSVGISELAQVLEISEAELEEVLEQEEARREKGYGLVIRRLEDRVQLATRPQYAKLLVERWLECTFAGGASAEKVERIMEIEQDYRK